MTESLRRIDPPGCGCTDCLTGYSRPLDGANDRMVRALTEGRLQDATSQELIITSPPQRFRDGQMLPPDFSQETVVTVEYRPELRWSW